MILSGGNDLAGNPSSLSERRNAFEKRLLQLALKAEIPVLGGTIYGDFFTPGLSAFVGVMSSGFTGQPGAGTATLSIELPYDPSLIGFTTYWQGFVLDSGSRLPIGISHTGGLAVTLVPSFL